MGNFCGSNHWSGQRLDVTQLFTVADQAARIALGNLPAGAGQANVGDLCIQTDTSQWYIMSTKSTPSVNGDWTAISAMEAALTAVNPAILGQSTVQTALAALAAFHPAGSVTSVRWYGPIAITPTNPILAHTEDTQAGIAVAGVVLQDIIFGYCPTLEAGLVIKGVYPTAADTVSVVISNVTAGNVATGAQNWYFVCHNTV